MYYTFPGTVFCVFSQCSKKVYREKNNLLFIVKNNGGSSSVCNECLGSPCVFVDPRCICIWNVSTLVYGAPRDLPFPCFNPFSCNLMRSIKMPHVAWQWNSYFVYTSKLFQGVWEDRITLTQALFWQRRSNSVELSLVKLSFWMVLWLVALEGCHCEI